jgi:hypothetical protein
MPEVFGGAYDEVGGGGAAAYGDAGAGEVVAYGDAGGAAGGVGAGV